MTNFTAHKLLLVISNTKGYTQVAGVDFTEHYAPVLNDITFRILLIWKMIHNHSARIIDVGTAFLHGDLKEEIYMKCPDGIGTVIEDVNEDDTFLVLKKPIYGLVQASREWWRKCVEQFINIGFVPNEADPCLLAKETKKG